TTYPCGKDSGSTRVGWAGGGDDGAGAGAGGGGGRCDGGTDGVTAGEGDGWGGVAPATTDLCTKRGSGFPRERSICVHRSQTSTTGAMSHTTRPNLPRRTVRAMRV